MSKGTKKRYLLALQYYGPAFEGWQKQSRGHTSVQETLEDVIFKDMGQRVNVVGASRTDSCVHALQQVAHVDLKTSLPTRALMARWNRRLPASVKLTSLRTVSPEFHAIKSALQKHYRYLIYKRGQRSPLYHDRAWCPEHLPDCQRMQAAVRVLLGKHDFKSFMATGADVLSTERTLYRVQIRENQTWIRFDLVGDGFLKHMVRNIVGTLVDIGYGRLPEDAMEKIVEARDRRLAGQAAPAQGLYLMRLWYPKHLVGAENA